ncbi:MAG TPA: hypothetical protein VF172_02645 [Nitrososphaera sp.]|jgi:hypothetical protein
MTVAKAAGYSLLLSLLFLYISPALQEPADAAVLEVVSRRFSAGYIPIIGSYVEYEVSLANVGAEAIEDRSLHVMVLSDGNKTRSYASYSVRELRPGESRMLYLGPFKIEDVGRHQLLAEMDGVSLQYEQDSFISYGQEAVQTVLIAIPLIAAGGGVVGFSLYKKRKAV